MVTRSVWLAPADRGRAEHHGELPLPAVRQGAHRSRLHGSADPAGGRWDQLIQRALRIQAAAANRTSTTGAFLTWVKQGGANCSGTIRVPAGAARLQPT